MGVVELYVSCDLRPSSNRNDVHPVAIWADSRNGDDFRTWYRIIVIFRVLNSISQETLVKLEDSPQEEP